MFLDVFKFCLNYVHSPANEDLYCEREMWEILSVCLSLSHVHELAHTDVKAALPIIIPSCIKPTSCTPNCFVSEGS